MMNTTLRLFSATAAAAPETLTAENGVVHVIDGVLMPN